MDKHLDSEFEKNHNSKQKGFFSYVFEYNEDKKTKLIKIAQYVTLGFIFYSIFVYVFDKYFPKIDDTCSSIEIIITLLLYCYIYFYSLYYIDRIICYCNSSFFGSSILDDRDITVFDIVTPALLATLSFNPQFQDGISIIFERINEAWNGNEKKQKKKKKSEQQQQQQPVSHTPITSSLYSGNTTPINQLPILQEGFTQQHQPVQQSLQQSLQQIHSPEEVNAPMAANEVVGGSFGSLF